METIKGNSMQYLKKDYIELIILYILEKDLDTFGQKFAYSISQSLIHFQCKTTINTDLHTYQ